MSGLRARILAAVDRFEPRRPPLAVGRSLLASAQLSLLLFTPDGMLFARDPGSAYAPGCGGVRRLSMWCLAGQGEFTVSAGRLAAAVVLVVVASGYRPRWTCVPHCYVAFSVNAAIIAPNGGERACQVATMLLVPVLLGDRRTWHWKRPEVLLPPDRRGSAYAALLVLRGQVAIIYLMAAGSKLANSPWRHGQAMYVIFQDPQFGVAPAVYGAFRPVFDCHPLTAAIGWTVIGVELAIGLSMVGPRRTRRCGLALAVGLHAAIIVLMGLVSFGLIMIGMVTLTVAGSPQPARIRAAVPDLDQEPSTDVDRDRVLLPG